MEAGPTFHNFFIIYLRNFFKNQIDVVEFVFSIGHGLVVFPFL